MNSRVHPVFTSHKFSEISEGFFYLLDIIHGDDDTADDGNEEKEIANIYILLTMSQAGTVPNAFSILNPANSLRR